MTWFTLTSPPEELFVMSLMGSQSTSASFPWTFLSSIFFFILHCFCFVLFSFRLRLSVLTRGNYENMLCFRKETGWHRLQIKCIRLEQSWVWNADWPTLINVLGATFLLPLLTIKTICWYGRVSALWTFAIVDGGGVRKINLKNRTELQLLQWSATGCSPLFEILKWLKVLWKGNGRESVSGSEQNSFQFMIESFCRSSVQWVPES